MLQSEKALTDSSGADGRAQAARTQVLV